MARFRIGLRLMLLVVALFAVCCATAGALMKWNRANKYQQRMGIETRLELLEIQHRSELKQLEDAGQAQATRLKLQRTEGAIEATREILDGLGQ